jgi:hypothetical protein
MHALRGSPWYGEMSETIDALYLLEIRNALRSAPKPGPKKQASTKTLRLIFILPVSSCNMSASTPEEESRADEKRAEQEEIEIEESLEESFPASDPPSWTLGRDDHEKDAPTP